MKLSLLTAFLALSSSALLTVAGQNCPGGVIPRKEIRDLSDDEYNRFVKAIKTLMKTPSKKYKGYSIYEEYAISHEKNSKYAHGSTEFLLWHRHFLYSFEKKLNEIDPNIKIPYWDWSSAQDAYAPQKSIVWKLFGNADGKDGCIVGGPFKNVVIKYPDPHCICRSFNPKKKYTKRFYDTRQIGEYIRKTRNFAKFSKNVEKAFHAPTHNFVGGGNCDMSEMSSPTDLIFYLHHAFIDKIFWDWQNAHDKTMKTYSGTAANGGKASLNNILTPFKAKAGDAVDTRDFCYTYQKGKTSGPKAISPSDDEEVEPKKGNKKPVKQEEDAEEQQEEEVEAEEEVAEDAPELEKRHIDTFLHDPINLDYEPDPNIPKSAYRFKDGDQWYELPPVPKTLAPLCGVSKKFIKMNGWDIEETKKELKEVDNFGCEVYNKMRKGISMTPIGYESGYDEKEYKSAPHKKSTIKEDCVDCKTFENSWLTKLTEKIKKACRDGIEDLTISLNLRKTY